MGTRAWLCLSIQLPPQCQRPWCIHIVLNSLQPVTVFIRAPRSQPLQLFLLVLGSPARVQVL